VQVADHRRGAEVPAGQVEGVLRRHVETGQPQPALVLAPLRDRIGEQVELGQGQVEPQPQEGEPPLLLGGCRTGAGPAQPRDVVPELSPEHPPAADQVALDARLGGRRQGRGRQHRLLDGERLDPVEPAEHGARLLFEQPGGELR